MSMEVNKNYDRNLYASSNGSTKANQKTQKAANGKDFDFRAALSRCKLTDEQIEDAKRLGRIVEGKATSEDVAIEEKKKAQKRNKQTKIMEEKKASTGLTYNEAKAIILNLQKKYKGKMSETIPENGGWRTKPSTKNLSDYDKKRLELANKTMTELEQKYGLDGDGYGINYKDGMVSSTLTPPTDVDRLVFTTHQTGYSYELRE